jgi:hypothetical protein
VTMTVRAVAEVAAATTSMATTTAVEAEAEAAVRCGGGGDVDGLRLWQRRTRTVAGGMKV